MFKGFSIGFSIAGCFVLGLKYCSEGHYLLGAIEIIFSLIAFWYTLRDA